jgi:predicted anti-sigma-YlaC factor YlaD
MDCNKFQDSISDYLEGALPAGARADCAGHRLVCRDCRELYNDVRVTVQALGADYDFAASADLESRIIAATSAGEMLSCGEFDKLLERYFDGVILAPTFQNFQSHFEHCAKCRRLMGGIEEAIDLCREAKEAEVEVPAALHDRIVAATIGVNNQAGSWYQRAQRGVFNLLRSWWTPQWAVAMLIFAASGLLILSRFGSVGGMMAHTSAQAEQWATHGQRTLSDTSQMAVQFGAFLFRGNESKQTTPRVEPPQPTPSPTATVDTTTAPATTPHRM